MTRRWLYWIGVSVNAGCTLANLLIGAWSVWQGRSSGVVNFLSASVTAGVIYGLTAIDTYARSKQAILAAALRSQDAMAAMHEDMLAKMKQSRIELGGEWLPDGADRDRPRRH
jgi:hypothetical protein